jgi:hypothetical protein
VQAALKALPRTSLSPTTPGSDLTAPSNNIPQRELRPSDNEYRAILESDVLKKARHFVGASRRSGQRRQGLAATITEGNEKGSWKIIPTQLASDMEVRWSSTHFMLQRIIELFPVSSEYQHFNSHTHLV